MKIIILLSLLVSPLTMAKDTGQWAQAPPDVRQWFQDQRVPHGPHKGFPCCSVADGEEVQEDIRAGEYWIKGGHFPDWTLVPDNAVIKGPNQHGQPIVWYYHVDGNPQIRCFAPGAGI